MKFFGFTKKIFLVSIISLALFGCSSGNVDDTGASGNDSNGSTADTRVITDSRGSVIIPANPERIVDISGSSDILSILGYKVVGTANSDAYDYTKFPSYLEDVLSGAEILGYSFQDTMDVEAILSLEPDLIIISKVQEKMYDTLSKVAPTIMIELEQLDWKEDIRKVATIMDRPAEAEAWISDYDKKAQELGSVFKGEYGEDKTYVSFLASGGQIFVFDNAGLGNLMYTDMGLKKPVGMPEQENITLPVVTYEGLAAIQADYFVAIGTEEDLSLLSENKIWQNLDAVKNGKVITLPSSPYFNQVYSPIGRLLFLDEFQGLMK